MDPNTEIGIWLVKEARLSFRYWYSSKTARKFMKQPFFDKNQANIILDTYKAEPEPRMAA